MSSDKRKEIICSGDRRGFALITAILAIMILMALGFLAISVTTGDLKITSRVVGEKKALSAAETGIHRLMQNFDPASMSSTQVTDVQVDSAADPASRYTIGNPYIPTTGPAVLPLTGYAVGGGQQWGQRCYGGSVTGKNTTYSSSVQIDVGMGYGPIEISTMSR
ncbi:MAG: pilus assembly PilX N-terminal domain-containing protein [Deltaproteobacteria bacterium]|nr:pilus assembly PilX N-terminal domain-containing protein [Deltaproteobacteria bacterium]